VSATRHRGRISRRVGGRELVFDLGDESHCAALERLHDRLDAHASTRLPWLRAWHETHPAWRPWILALADERGELRAAAALARRSRAGLIQIRGLGHGTCDRAPIISRTAEDAYELTGVLVDRLEHLGRPWTFGLQQLPEGEPVATMLSRRLAAVEVYPGADRPVVLLHDDRRPNRVLSRNLRSAEAKARNRIARSGLRLEERWVTGAQEIAERLAEIRYVHRARDLDLRPRSLLDDRVEGAFYDALLRQHLDVLELFELRLDHEMAAYVLWICTRGARLVLDNRVAPRWKPYSAGLIANNAALRTAAADRSIKVLDWGTGPQRYKLQSANKVVPHMDLLAWSSRAVRGALAARRRFRLPVGQA
jgi:hypothetical protein